MSKDPFFAPLSGASAKKTAKAAALDFVSVTPVPADAPAHPKRHPSFGVPSRMEAYYSPDRALLGFQCRFDREDGSKAFQPLRRAVLRTDRHGRSRAGPAGVSQTRI